MTLVKIGAALLLGIVGNIIASDPALSLNNLAHYNARLAIKLVVPDGRSAFENIFLSDLAAFESHSIRFGRSFTFYIATIKYNMIYFINFIKLEISLPCCFLQCSVSSWVGGIEQWKKDALSTLTNQNLQALAALSPTHSKLLQAKIDHIEAVASDYQKLEKQEKFNMKFFEHEKACLAQSNIDIYRVKPFPEWAPFREKRKSLEWMENFDSIKQKKIRKEYENFWERALSEEKKLKRHYLIVYTHSAAIFSLTTAHLLLRTFRQKVTPRLDLRNIRRIILMRLLAVKEPKPMTARLVLHDNSVDDNIT